MAGWQPTASLDMLAMRARFLAQIRAFFAERGVMEVDVPVLSHAAVTDPNIDCFTVTARANDASLFLVTSPEYSMKRLLAAGYGSIYFLGHVFRAGDRGSRHQPEFAMLEWYRPGWTLAELQHEVVALLSLWWPEVLLQQVTYRDAFLSRTGLDPHSASIEQLKACAFRHLSPVFDCDDRDTWMDLLFSHLVEPDLQGIVFVSEFPESQAALARIGNNAQGHQVAERFELYINGIEIANAYQEETEAKVLAERFQRDLGKRASRGQYLPPIDEDFLAAMQAGLPDCAGIAVGVDRLLMVLAGKSTIQDVLPFGR